MAPPELELELELEVEEDEVDELELEEDVLLELEEELLLEDDEDELEESPSSPAHAKSAAAETSTPANFIVRIASDSDRIVSIKITLGLNCYSKKRQSALQLVVFVLKNLHHEVTPEPSYKP